jgi:acyl-CoA thioesterase-1
MNIADRSSYLREICQMLGTHWPANRTVNVVCHGHSVPAGYFATPMVDTMNAYPHLLHVGLKHRFPFAVMNVIVTAIGGENSESGAARFEQEVLCHRPDVITIDYGLNDRSIGLERARASWSRMIDASRACGA